MATDLMTAEQFNKFWTSAYPGTIPMQHCLRDVFADRWFRIHSLPGSKRYAGNDDEWDILLSRQNQIISDLLGDHPDLLLVTGKHSSEGYIELHQPEQVNSIRGFSFVILEPIDLNRIEPAGYEQGQFFTPMFCELTWQLNIFNNLLRDIADDNLRAFFISMDRGHIIAPYDGGVDFILKDTETRDLYKKKYAAWLSAREDGL